MKQSERKVGQETVIIVDLCVNVWCESGAMKNSKAT